MGTLHCKIYQLTDIFSVHK